MNSSSDFKSILVCVLAVLLSSGTPCLSKDILVEAESFETKGGWKTDQQFMDLMGSPYLIAHGMGVPVEDACTEIDVEEAGEYHVFVRTYNWTSPWADKEGPGGFKVKVGTRVLRNRLGVTGSRWEWQYAGKANLKTGKTCLSLCDLTGFDGRRDVIFLSKDSDPELPDTMEELDEFRRKMGTLPSAPAPEEKFDFVVVGGGVAGMCAAVAAARGGANVALVNDRPVLGGNNSSEIRVHLGGRIETGLYPALGRMLREFGHSKGGNAKPASFYEDEKKARFIAGEKNVRLFASYRAVAVKKSDESHISSVIIRHVETGEELELSAPLFSDCTGDATIGFMAGADWRMGREGREEYGESMAPEMADKLTMGTSVQWYSVSGDRKTSFPEFNYGIAFNDETCEKVFMGEWRWETGMNYDQITQFERIRDYGLLVVYSNWSYLKNHYADKDKYADRSLDWVAYIGGKRESRRLLGDYVLKQDDIDKHVFHEDASFTTTWSIDLHFPDPKNSKNFPGAEFKAETVHNTIYPCDVPYRCLYSRNIDNLFMAGRNISVTHVALGTVRVMRTTAMMGEVVGMAAAICKDKKAEPRDVYRKYLNELKTKMKAGAAVEGELPDNQKFNVGKSFTQPKYLNRQ